MAQLDFRTIWDAKSIPYEQFLEQVEKNESLWRGLYKTAHVPDWALELACEVGRDVRLLIIAEDWCGDASSTVPVLARLGDEAECLEIRIIRRDEHPEIMDEYLTNDSRSIPIVIAIDGNFNERGHWGPRPRELQEWVMANKLTMPSKERYLRTRRWYATDRGVTTLREVLALFAGNQQTETPQRS
jgi:hypothetical protein